MKTATFIRGGWKLSAIVLVITSLTFAGISLNVGEVEATGYHHPSPTPTPSPTPKPTPSPTPIASPSPTPPVGGSTNVTNNDNDNENENENENENTNSQKQNQENNQNQDNDQENDQENNQTVNVTQNVTTGGTGTVAGTSTGLKQPETGLGVLGTTSMFGALPVGFALSRFGRGRIGAKREEESLSEIGSNLVESRKANGQDAQ